MVNSFDEFFEADDMTEEEIQAEIDDLVAQEELVPVIRDGQTAYNPTSKLLLTEMLYTLDGLEPELQSLEVCDKYAKEQFLYLGAVLFSGNVVAQKLLKQLQTMAFGAQ